MNFSCKIQSRGIRKGGSFPEEAPTNSRRDIWRHKSIGTSYYCVWFISLPLRWKDLFGCRDFAWSKDGKGYSMILPSLLIVVSGEVRSLRYVFVRLWICLEEETTPISIHRLYYSLLLISLASSSPQALKILITLFSSNIIKLQSLHYVLREAFDNFFVIASGVGIVKWNRRKKSSPQWSGPEQWWLSGVQLQVSVRLWPSVTIRVQLPGEMDGCA